VNGITRNYAYAIDCI